MSKFCIKIGNVYIARRLFVDRFGRESEGKLCLAVSKLTAVKYSSVAEILADLERLNASLDQIEVEKVG